MIPRRWHRFEIVAAVFGVVLSVASGLSTKSADWNRRALLHTLPLILVPTAAAAAANDAPQKTANAPDPVVTTKVFFNVRISRQDGTFYVRDDLPDTPENQVYQGRLVLGLFDQAAPNHVKRFLNYVTTSSDEDPSYSRSIFSQLDPATGVLYGGAIPSLTATEFQGGAALQYGGRLTPASLWMDPTNLSHNAAGLLTHNRLDATPSFGITTRPDVSLDRTHTVFGKLLLDADAAAFLQRVAELPTYSVDRASNDGVSTVDTAASAIFAAQRDMFRSAAKSLGDDRVGKLYDGKLLRRVEVTQVGVL